MTSSTIFEPSPRWGHYSAAVGEQLYIMGGCTENFSGAQQQCVHAFNQRSEQWQTKDTTGSFPPGVYCGACTATDRHFYVYGGHDGFADYHYFLYQLDIETLEWLRLPSGPITKGGCRIISYKSQLILLGGCSTQPETDFSQCNGWNNEVHCFNLKEGEERATAVRPGFASRVFGSLCSPVLIIKRNRRGDGGDTMWHGMTHLFPNI